MNPEITPFDWHRMLIGDSPILFMAEIVVRVVIIYLFAGVMLHALGKRGQKQLTPLEYIVIIALGSATGDGMIYPEVPIVHALVVIAALMVVIEIIEQLKLRIPALARYVDTRPTTLVEAGRLMERNVRAERLSEAEVLGMLREAGVANLGHVRYAFLEVTGGVSVFRYPPGEEVAGEAIVPPAMTKYSSVGRGGISGGGPTPP